MRLFIRLQDGQPFEHPIMEDNFVAAFPKVDLNNLPNWVAEFRRVQVGEPGVYEVYVGSHYEWNGPIVEDVHVFRDMTEAEKLAKQNEVKEDWAQNGFPSWIFDEGTCAFNPPVPYPDDGGKYRWDEETTSWVLVE